MTFDFAVEEEKEEPNGAGLRNITPEKLDELYEEFKQYCGQIPRMHDLHVISCGTNNRIETSPGRVEVTKCTCPIYLSTSGEGFANRDCFKHWLAHVKKIDTLNNEVLVNFITHICYSTDEQCDNCPLQEEQWLTDSEDVLPDEKAFMNLHGTSMHICYRIHCRRREIVF